MSAVHHPEHYSRWKMEPIEFIAINDMPWWMANVVKYIMRYDAKDGLQDLYKARAYLEMQIRKLECIERFWVQPVEQERGLADMWRNSFPMQPDDFQMPKWCKAHGYNGCNCEQA